MGSFATHFQPHRKSEIRRGFRGSHQSRPETRDELNSVRRSSMKAHASGFSRAKAVLNGENEIALLIGNGINNAVKNNRGISWKQLMESLVAEASGYAENPDKARIRLLRLLTENEHKRTPASNPEVFDLIESTCNLVPGSSSPTRERLSLHNRIAELFARMEPGAPHRALISWAAARGVPVMTTNYDHCLQDAVEAAPRRIFGTRRLLSDRYPWNRYYAPQSVRDPIDSFAVWHIHGDRSLKRSIRIGLDEYMGMVERLRKLKHGVAKEILSGPREDQTRDPAYHAAPWLRIFMGRKLWIQGLALHGDEVSLRWLLIQRFRYWKRYKPGHRRCSGWYIHGPVKICGKLDDGRRAFLESVGLQIIEINKSENIYENLFNKAAREK